MNNTKIYHFIFWAMTFFVVLQFASCSCEEHDFPIAEVPDPFLVTDVGPVDEVINITFNKSIETTNLEIGENIFISNSNGMYTGGYEADGFFMQLYPFADFICEGLANCPLEIRLSGDMITGVRTLEGQILDGDANGTDGGDYMTIVNVACSVVLCPRVISDPWAAAPTLVGDFSDFIIDSIVVRFNKPMNIASVVSDKSLLMESQHGMLDFGQNQVALIWNNEGTSFRMYNVYVGGICQEFDVNIPDCNCDLTLTLTNDVRDIEGNSLDCTIENHTNNVTVFEPTHVNYLGNSTFVNDMGRAEIGPFSTDHFLDLGSVNNNSLLVQATNYGEVIAVEDYSLEEGQASGEYVVVINNLPILIGGYDITMTFKGAGNDRILDECGQSLDNNFNTVLGDIEDDFTITVFVF